MKDYKSHTFLKLLNNRNITYHYDDKWLVVGGNKNGTVNLSFKDLTSLPDNIKFNNNGWVDLSFNKLKSLPNHIEFNNSDNIVSLSGNLLTSLPDGIQFNNHKSIFLYENPFESLPDNIDEFYDRLDKNTKEYLQKTFSDHWVVNKERFGL